jgi:8-amino-7-oxononanoate synthase
MDVFKDQLECLQKAGLYRTLRDIEGPQAATMVIDGRKVLQFSSNDYLGLANHPRLKTAAHEAIEHYGSGCGASRLVSGNLALNGQLEKKIADLKGQESGLLFSTGYMANLGIVNAIVGEGDAIFSDQLNHASIVDACRMSKADTKVYPHGDMESLEAVLRQSGQYRQKLLVTDGVFSMEGDIAPLPDLVNLADRYECMLMVDDAHATGVLGANGGGTGEHFGLEDKIDISMGTFGKALGGFGAFAAGDRTLRLFLINCARTLMFTTGLPPAVIASALAALKVLEEEPALREKLWENTHFFRKGIERLGFPTTRGETPIISLLIGDAALTMRMGEMLFEKGFYMQGIRPPAVPQGSSRLRITIMATHTGEQLENALDALKVVGKQLGLI